MFLNQGLPYAQAAETSCSYAREYITTLEFLRSQKVFSIGDPEARNIAMKVSRGCSGAAQRFIRVSSTLSKSGLGSRDSLLLGVEFATRKDEEVQTFHTVFLTTFLEDHLNLDLEAALRIARSLTTEFKGDTLAVRKDFMKLVHFCTDEKDLNLPKPQCANFAARLAQQSEKWEAELAAGFIQIFNFLRSDNGPSLTTAQALQLAEILFKGGKEAPSNFTQAYRYAVSAKGLSLGAKDAVQFAQSMTVPEDSQAAAK